MLQHDTFMNSTKIHLKKLCLLPAYGTSIKLSQQRAQTGHCQNDKAEESDGHDQKRSNQKPVNKIKGIYRIVLQLYTKTASKMLCPYGENAL